MAGISDPRVAFGHRFPSDHPFKAINHIVGFDQGGNTRFYGRDRNCIGLAKVMAGGCYPLGNRSGAWHFLKLLIRDPFCPPTDLDGNEVDQKPSALSPGWSSGRRPSGQ